jgi:hypothetical protein
MVYWNQEEFGYELCLFESVYPLGVRLVKFKEIAESIGDFYDKVVLRHLEFERSEQMIDAFDDFYD